MSVHAEADGRDRSLVFVHGFTQTGRSWRRIVESLGTGNRATTVDAPGHGTSSSLRCGLVDGAAEIGRAGGRAVYVGYSMGARFALHLALQSSDLVEGLVLLGGTPGIADSTERMARRAADEVLASRIEEIGVPAFIDEWLANPLFAGLPVDPVDRADRASNSAAGLASSLRLAGTGAQLPLWDQLDQLSMPVLVLAGERDTKFSDIGRRMTMAIGPSATFATIPAAGHSAHLEQPDGFLDVIGPWLGDVPI